MEGENIVAIHRYEKDHGKATLRRNIFIPANTIISSAPAEITYIENHYELIIEIGDGHTATLTISESALRAINTIEPKVSIY